MGLENIREIEFRYVVRYPDTGTLHIFYRTLEQIEQEKDFPTNKAYQIVAKNQYVGLKDIKGIRVYEHDVVKMCPDGYKKQEIIGVIRWRYGGFIMEPFVNPLTLTTYYTLRYGKLEVIGDIYHNKNKDAKIHGGRTCD